MNKSLGKRMSSKYGQKLLDITKTLATDVFKTDSERALEKEQKELVM